MSDHKMYDFDAGDIVRYKEKTFQVHENLGMSGLVAEFPSPEVMLVVVTWDDDYVKTGNEPLADTSSCGSCDSARKVLYRPAPSTIMKIMPVAMAVP